MMDSYLWNRSGKPDPQIVRLEKQLGQFRYGGPVRRPRNLRFAWLAVAAALILGTTIALPLWLSRPVTNWKTASGRRVRAGQLIETGALHDFKIAAEDTGEVTIDPRSRFRLIASNPREERFDLQRGTIHAFIWAPPGRFVVDTPSTRAVDLGCRYTLQVSENGNGLLTVELGWVAFEKNKIESFIPAGAVCVTRRARGPGTPYFTDAAPAFREALNRFDERGDTAELSSALNVARERDGLSLWHLMVRTSGVERGKVFDRLSSLITLPPQASRQAILDGNHAAIDAAWGALNLGGTDWWREWKQPW